MAAADSPDDESPQPTPHARDRLPSNPMARRAFLRRSAIGAAAAIATTAGSSGSALAEDLHEHPDGDSLGGVSTTDGWTVLFEGTQNLVDYTFGSGFDSEVIHEETYSTARLIEEDRNNMFDSIEHNVQMLRGWLRANIGAELANVYAEGGNLDDMHEAASDALRRDVARVERNLFNTWLTDFEQAAKAIYEVAETGHDPTSGNHIFLHRYDEAEGGTTTEPLQHAPRLEEYQDWEHIHLEEYDDLGTVQALVTFELVNGDSITIPQAAVGSDNGTALSPYASAELINAEPTDGAVGIDTEWHQDMEMFVNASDYTYDDFADAGYDLDPEWHKITHSLSVYPYDATTDDRADLINAQRFTAVHRDLLDLLDDELSNATTIVDNFGQALLDGEISAHDVASGNAVLEAAADPENWIQASMYYRMVDYPEGEEPVVVELENGIELQGALFWTAPDDENGLPVGEWIDPEDTVGQIHMGAEVRSVEGYDGGSDGDEEEVDGDTDGDDLDADDEDFAGPISFTEPFKITGIEGDESGPLMFDSVELDEVTNTEDMMARIRDANEREQEAKESEDSDTTVNVDIENPIGAGAGLFDGLGDNFGYFGLGLIAVSVLAVVGFVMDLIPGLGD